jgi:hypothetical protein
MRYSNQGRRNQRPVTKPWRDVQWDSRGAGLVIYPDDPNGNPYGTNDAQLVDSVANAVNSRETRGDV